MQREIKLRKCPLCGGNKKLMANPFHIESDCDCFTRCKECRKKYDLPTVKLKILKNLKVSKTTLREASIAWNKQVELLEG
jgi:hypothetical protein